MRTDTVNSDERRKLDRALKREREQDTYSRGVARSYSRLHCQTRGDVVDVTPDHIKRRQRASGRSRRATVVLAPNVSGYAFTPWGCV